MPQVYNGIGTWYYGKKNLQQYPGTCRHCNNQTTLSSYDTRLWFVFVMIPVVPLGRKRIIEECATCRRHGAMPLADYELAHRRGVETIEAYRRSPKDAEAAKEALGACVGFRNLPAFLELAPHVEQHLAHDADAMMLLAGVYEIFGRLEDSERVLRVALAARDDDETRQALGTCVLNLGRPEEAEPLLQHIAEKGIPDRVDALYHLAQSYQTKGNHEKALHWFAQCEVVNPLIAKDETFVRLRDASLKHMGTRVAVRPSEVVAKAKSAEQFRKFMRVAPVVVGVLGIAYLGLAFYQGVQRKVFLVNGLNKPYTVRVNGTSHHLPANGHVPVRVAEGDLRVEVEGAPAGVGAETVSVRTPFLTRPFSDSTFVINPDGAAVLERMRVYYAAKGSTASSPDVTFEAGQVSYEIDDIDHAFESPPETVKTESSKRDVSRTVLALLSPPPGNGPMVLAGIAEQIGQERAARIAQRHVLFEPEQSEYFYLLAGLMKPQEAAAFLRPFLERRPLMIDAHRAYQTAMGKAGQDEQLEREYEAMLAKEPGDNELVYLAGRASRNIDRVYALYRQAAEHRPPSAHALYSLSGYYTANGLFAEAADAMTKAAELMPKDVTFRHYLRNALIAAGQFDRALELIASDRALPTVHLINSYSDEAYVHAIRADRQRAQQAAQNLKSRLGEYGPEVQEAQARRVEAQIEYASGNPARYVQLMRQSPEADDRFVADLTNGDLDAAERDLQRMKPEAQHHLLMHLGAVLGGRGEVAERHLKRAADLLAKGDYEARAFAKALGGTPELPVTDLVRLRGQPEEKMLQLVALGLRDPAAREACFTLARKLNYDRRFPHLLINRVMEQASRR